MTRISPRDRAGLSKLAASMEFLEGESLDERLDRVERLSIAEALPVLRGVASAIDAAHREQVIHRDLKPDNVFLASRGKRRERVKILDFGIAKLAAGSVKQTQAGIAMSWLVIHEIDEQSPLYGIDAQGFEEGDVRILANLTGHDGTFSDTIYDNHIYWPEDVYFGSNFVDVVEVLPERKFRLDLSRFHDVTPPES